MANASDLKINVKYEAAVKEKESSVQLAFMEKRSLTKKERQLLRDQLKSGGDIIVSTFAHASGSYTEQSRMAALITFKER